MKVKKNIAGINLILILVILFGITNLVAANAQLIDIQSGRTQESQGTIINVITPPLINAADMTPEQRRQRLVELKLNLETFNFRLTQIQTELRRLRALPQTDEIRREIAAYEALEAQLLRQIADTEAEIARLESMN